MVSGWSNVSAATEKDGRKVRALERRSQRRLQILSAARKVFSLKGYHASSVSDILKEAGIARGTFYLYFPSKRAIFDELLEQMFSQISRAVRRVRTEPGSEPVLEQMSRNVYGVVNVLEQNRELTIILLREAVGLDADFDQKLTAFYDRISRMIEAALRLGQTMGLVRACDPRLISRCVLGSLKEVMIGVLLSDSPVDRETLAREILDYNLLGLFTGTPEGSGAG
jgi:AcrR family transcriptional regulator